MITMMTMIQSNHARAIQKPSQVPSQIPSSQSNRVDPIHKVGGRGWIGRFEGGNKVRPTTSPSFIWVKLDKHSLTIFDSRRTCQIAVRTYLSWGQF